MQIRCGRIPLALAVPVARAFHQTYMCYRISIKKSQVSGIPIHINGTPGGRVVAPCCFIRRPERTVTYVGIGAGNKLVEQETIGTKCKRHVALVSQLGGCRLAQIIKVVVGWHISMEHVRVVLDVGEPRVLMAKLQTFICE